MSLSILNSHNGERHTTDAATYESLEAFKIWLANETAIAAADQILLLNTGKQARLPSLQVENEIFLYSRKLISASSSDTRAILGTFSPLSQSVIDPPSNPPDILSDPNDVHAWQQLFAARAEWARELEYRSQTLASEVRTMSDAVATIQKGLGVAVGNLQAHIRSLESKYNEATLWLQQANTDQAELLRVLKRVTREQLGVLPAHLGFVRFLPKLELSANLSQSEANTTLEAFVRFETMADATTTIERVGRVIQTRVDALGTAVDNVRKDKDKLVATIETMNNTRSILNNQEAVYQLIEEIEVVTRKIVADAEYLAGLSTRSPQSISQASKMASKHTRDYLPVLIEQFEEIVDIARRFDIDREQSASQSIQHMQTIARIEAAYTQVNSQYQNINVPQQDAEYAFEYVNLLCQLPFVYGALLVEAVRRREWSERLKAESATLAEDIAGYREEEERRRKRWLKNFGHLVDDEAASGNAINFELNLAADEENWPEVNRADITDYLRNLRKLDCMNEAIEELTESVKDLDRPTKRQIKRAQANSTFKHGSIHEAATNKGSFLLRETDEIRIMRETNVKLEEELRGQKSRVRKLEDLLYKQQQSTRVNAGNLFGSTADIPGQRFEQQQQQQTQTPFEPSSSPSSKAEDVLSRRTSTTSRRTSTAMSVDEKAMARRIVALEAELQDERQKRREEKQSRLDHENRISRDIEESHSTKKDLMENMEAQQREFANERKLLQEEVREQRLKVEEMEDELDRILGSRDNERQEVVEKITNLEMGTKDANRQLDILQLEKTSRAEADAEHLTALQKLHFDLVSIEEGQAQARQEQQQGESKPPSTIAMALHELEHLVEKSSRQLFDLKHIIEESKAEKEIVQAGLEKHEKELMSIREQLRATEAELSVLRNDYALEQATAESTTRELEDARAQLKMLRSKFAEGETGSDSLKRRLEEQATRASDLAKELAQSKSHVNSLDFELSSLQHRHNIVQGDAITATKRLEERCVRDRELTQRLVNTTDELTRLLDSLGLSIIRHSDNTLAIQRTSKLAASASSSALVEPNSTASMMVTGSTFSTIPTIDLRPDPSLIHWMQAATREEEDAQFSALMAKLTTLELTTFSDAVIKLRRDVEWTGKKWKQEARNYREKYHRVQSEGHEKIAYRSFKEGDLALFLPTRNQATRPWAAFNVGAPHYFLREQDVHKLQDREWLVARISKVQERVVDLSKPLGNTKIVALAGRDSNNKDRDALSIKSTASEGGISYEDDNPFELSDGLRWYLIDATEEKPGAPSTPGLGKSTVASANVDAKGSIRMKRTTKGNNDISTKLNKSLESRRSSTSSKRASITATAAIPEDSPAAIAATAMLGHKRSTSSSHLRPGSRSSAVAAMANETAVTSTNISPRGSPRDELRLNEARFSDEQHHGSNAKSSRPIPTATISTSPRAAAFLGLFGRSASPPRAPSAPSTTPSPFKLRPARVQSSDQIPKASSQLQAQQTPSTQQSMDHDSPSKASSVRQQQQQQQQQQQTLLPQRNASPTKSPSKSTGSIRGIGSGHENSSNRSQDGTSPSRLAQQRQTPQRKPRSAWESLWSLDVGIEEGSSRHEDT